MHAEQAVLTAKRVQLSLGDPALLRQRRIERQSRVTFRQHEAVAVRIVRRGDAQHVAIQRREDLDDAEAGPDVPHVGPPRLIENRAAHSRRVNSGHQLRREPTEATEETVFTRRNGATETNGVRITEVPENAETVLSRRSPRRRDRRPPLVALRAAWIARDAGSQAA